MIACHCHAVTDREVMNSIVAGAACVPSIGQHCAAGTDCGGCHRTLSRLLGAVRAVDAVFDDEASSVIAEPARSIG
ncbi:MAG: (2Fe-2S)-binding protein [Acidimicrobiales bacterium]